MFFQITWTQPIEPLEIKNQQLKPKSGMDVRIQSGVCGTKKAGIDNATSC